MKLKERNMSGFLRGCCRLKLILPGKEFEYTTKSEVTLNVCIYSLYRKKGKEKKGNEMKEIRKSVSFFLLIEKKNKPKPTDKFEKDF